jgi:hypothetical protein
MSVLARRTYVQCDDYRGGHDGGDKVGGLHTFRGCFWLNEELSAYQEGLLHGVTKMFYLERSVQCVVSVMDCRN